MIKVSVISYTNTKPFAFGLSNYEPIKNEILLSYDSPSLCAEKLIDGRVDVGLVPVGALNRVPEYHRISNYCIGSNGAVNSVFLFSNLPFGSLKYVCLDNESNTSNLLARVLNEFYWKAGLEFLNAGVIEGRSVILKDDANGLICIGDRTFNERQKWKYSFDLSSEWHKFTGLPFVFAQWISNRNLGNEFETLFNEALKFGLGNMAGLIQSLEPAERVDLRDYLTKRISYVFDESKQVALHLFFHLVSKLSLTSSRLKM